MPGTPRRRQSHDLDQPRYPPESTRPSPYNVETPHSADYLPPLGDSRATSSLTLQWRARAVDSAPRIDSAQEANGVNASPLHQLPNTYRAFYGAFPALRPFQIEVITPL